MRRNLFFALSRFFVLSGFVGAFLASTARDGGAVEPVIEITRGNEKSRISDINRISADFVSDFMGIDGLSYYVRVRLTGVSDKTDSDYLIESKKTQTSAPGEFSKIIVLSQEAAEVEILSIDILGQTQEETVHVRVQDWKEKEQLAKDRFIHKMAFQAMLGPSTISYSETGLRSFSEIATTLKASLSYAIISGWQIGINAYGNLIAFGSNHPDDLTIKFFGANLRFGPTTSPGGSKWQFSFLTGLSFSSTAVKNDAFGYRSVLYPQVYPNVFYQLSKELRLSSYLKYVPLTPKLFDLNLKDREWATGIAVNKQIYQSTIRSWSVSIDYSDFEARFTPSHVIQYRSTSLAFGLGW